MAKKILYVINHMDWFWSHRLSPALAAQKAGYEILICAPNADKDDKLSQYGFKGYALNKIHGPVCVWRAMQKIKTILRAERPDLLHAITLKYALPAGLAGRDSDVNVIHTIAGLGYLFAGDGWKPKLLRTFVTPFLKRAFLTPRTKMIFQNGDDKALMEKRGFASAEQTHLIKGSGVDLSQYNATPLPQNDIPLILFPTRLVWEKGINVFIAAANMLQERGVKARYAIAGGISKTNPSAITESAMNNALKGSPVEWLGHVTNMPELLQQSTLIAYPSWYGEGIPKVLLEAAASARPIITTDHPGCRDVVKPGENGYLVPIKDSNALAKAIEGALKDKKSLQKMGEMSRKRAESEFDVTLVNQQTLALYDDF